MPAQHPAEEPGIARMHLTARERLIITQRCHALEGSGNRDAAHLHVPTQACHRRRRIRVERVVRPQVVPSRPQIGDDHRQPGLGYPTRLFGHPVGEPGRILTRVLIHEPACVVTLHHRRGAGRLRVVAQVLNERF